MPALEVTRLVASCKAGALSVHEGCAFNTSLRAGGKPGPGGSQGARGTYGQSSSPVPVAHKVVQVELGDSTLAAAVTAVTPAGLSQPGRGAAAQQQQQQHHPARPSSSTSSRGMQAPGRQVPSGSKQNQYAGHGPAGYADRSHSPCYSQGSGAQSYSFAQQDDEEVGSVGGGYPDEEYEDECGEAGGQLGGCDSSWQGQLQRDQGGSHGPYPDPRAGPRGSASTSSRDAMVGPSGPQASGKQGRSTSTSAAGSAQAKAAAGPSAWQSVFGSDDESDGEHQRGGQANLAVGDSRTGMGGAWGASSNEGTAAAPGRPSASGAAGSGPAVTDSLSHFTNLGTTLQQLRAEKGTVGAEPGFSRGPSAGDSRPSWPGAPYQEPIQIHHNHHHHSGSGQAQTHAQGHMYNSRQNHQHYQHDSDPLEKEPSFGSVASLGVGGMGGRSTGSGRPGPASTQQQQQQDRHRDQGPAAGLGSLQGSSYNQGPDNDMHSSQHHTYNHQASRSSSGQGPPTGAAAAQGTYQQQPGGYGIGGGGPGQGHRAGPRAATATQGPSEGLQGGHGYGVGDLGYGPGASSAQGPSGYSQQQSQQPARAQPPQPQQAGGGSDPIVKESRQADGKWERVYASGKRWVAYMLHIA